MGMFDTVWVTCPHCSERTDLQSKSGNCMLDSFELNDAPLSVMGDLVDGGGWRQCWRCKGEIKIVANGRPVFTAVKPEQEDV